MCAGAGAGPQAPSWSSVPLGDPLPSQGLRTCCCCGRRHFPALRSSLVQKMPLVQKMRVRHCGPAGVPQLCWDLARRALAVASASGTSASPPQRPWAPAFSLVHLSPVTPRGQGTGGGGGWSGSRCQGSDPGPGHATRVPNGGTEVFNPFLHLAGPGSLFSVIILGISNLRIHKVLHKFIIYSFALSRTW